MIDFFFAPVLRASLELLRLYSREYVEYASEV